MSEPTRERVEAALARAESFLEQSHPMLRESAERAVKDAKLLLEQGDVVTAFVKASKALIYSEGIAPLEAHTP